MRIQLIAKGNNSVAQFRTGLDSLENKINETVNSLQSVNNKFDNLTGGLGNLSSAKGNIVERIRAEEAKREAVRQTATKTDEFIRNTVDTDNRVATNVSDSQREFFEKYTWLRPADIDVNSKSWFDKLKDWLGDIFTSIHEKLSLAWEILKKSIKEKAWYEWFGTTIGMGEKIIKLIDKYKDYLRIGRIFGNYKAKIYFLDSFFKVDRVSTFSSFCGRVYNNLHNLTSPYSLSDIFEALTGGKGVKVAFAEWGGIVFGALCNFLGNLDEQKESGGIMSTARVIAETISETVIEVTLELAGAAVVGAVAAAAGVAISPTLILLGGVVLGQGVNTVVGILNDGETFTEWFSDLILDFPEKIGNAIWGNDDSIVVWEIEL